MTTISKANDSALMIGAGALLVESVEIIYMLANRMTKEEKQHYIRWAHAVKNWQAEVRRQGENAES
jgi:hypothetical protein